MRFSAPSKVLLTSLLLVSPLTTLAAGPSDEMRSIMKKSMTEMNRMKMTGSTDHDFAMMMRHHHQSGVEMARVELRSGTDPEMRKMALKIVDSQTKEIAEFDAWLKAHPAPSKK